MGLFIHLFVNPTQIAPGQWEQTYQESLAIFRQFPLPLMQAKKEERYDQKRWTDTRNLVQNEGRENEFWEVCGDLLSRQQSETFRLYRSLTQQIAYSSNRQPENAVSAWADKDILWAYPEEMNGIAGNGFPLFQHKTQGYPYHLALLAVGILFENRFPYSIYVIGDLERYPIEMMVEWLNTTVETPVTLPVCLDGRWLYQRLQALYPSPEMIISRFKAIYRGSREEQLTHLLQSAARNDVFTSVQTALARFRSLSQIGAQDLLAQFLSVTQDLKQTIALVQTIQESDPERHEFSLETLLQVLCQNYITIDFQAREPLACFARAADRLPTIQDAFAQTFIRFKGTPAVIDYYLESTALLTLFSAYAPEKSDTFANIIGESEAQCRAALQAIRSKFAQSVQTSDPDAPASAEPIPAGETWQSGGTRSRAAEYIVQQAYRQQERFKEPERSAQTMGELVRTFKQNAPKQFQSSDPHYYRTEICRASGANGFALCETIWQQIEQEQTIPILQAILALASSANRESNFWRWRRYILEQPTLWPYLTAT